jgi:phosphopantetheinyl transferase
MAIIKIRGVLVDMLLEIASDVYKDFVTTDKKGTKQLIVQCQNAIYGTMVASLHYKTDWHYLLLTVPKVANSCHWQLFA